MFTPANVSLFTAPLSGAEHRGREANDANNKMREQMVVALLNCSPQVEDPAFDSLRGHTEAYVFKLKNEYEISEDAPVRATLMAGRRHNYDISLKIGPKTFEVEFKYGASSVKDLPEFFNPAANKDYHQGESYARFFYRTALAQVCSIYGLDLATYPMTEDEYATKVHGTSKKPALFKALYDAEKAGTEEQKAAKKKIVDESIEEWLNQVKDKTDIAAISVGLKNSQTMKKFLLCKDGVFYSDSIPADALELTGALSVRKGKYLVLETKMPGTSVEMLLRWKNHAGILYPAWQISMRMTKDKK